MEGNLHLKIEEGFLRYRFGGLIFGGAYTWRGLFSDVYGIFAFGSTFFAHKVQ